MTDGVDEVVKTKQNKSKTWDSLREMTESQDVTYSFI